MIKFITIKCKSCGSVIYNLPEQDFKKLKLVDLLCEDCLDAKEESMYETESKVLLKYNTIQTKKVC